MKRIVLAAALATFLVTPPVRADVVPTPKIDCPNGSTVSSTHIGEWCTPNDCTADSDCTAGRVCRDQPLCIQTDLRANDGRHAIGGPSNVTIRNVVGTCEPGGSCAYPAQCSESSKRCVKSGLVERYRASCGCEVLGLDRGEGWAALVTAIGVAALAGRRARRSREV